jgi:hypothetical protein
VIVYDSHMIRRRTRCFVCDRLAARTVVIDGMTVPMCSDCPTPTEVYERVAELRETWPAWRWEQARRDEPNGEVDMVPIAWPKMCD